MSNPNKAFLGNLNHISVILKEKRPNVFGQNLELKAIVGFRRGRLIYFNSPCLKLDARRARAARIKLPQALQVDYMIHFCSKNYV